MTIFGSTIRRAGTLTLVFVFSLMSVLPLIGQESKYKFDIGAGLGLSGYLGDANRSNPFKSTGFTAQADMRYIGDTRWAIRGVLSTLSLSGTTEGNGNVLPDGEILDFKSQVYELSVRGEFNFFAYGIGESYKRLRRVSPYLTLGVGMAVASTGGNTYVSPTIPMGLGVKFKLRERLNLGVEWTMTKTFNDHFDSKDLADINDIKIKFYKNTDWYSRITIGLSYEFGERCETCHYVD